MSVKRIGVLVSGGGTNLQSIIDNIHDGCVNAEISLVISNTVEAFALERARKHNIPAVFIDRGLYSSSEQYDDELICRLAKYNVDLVVLAGYLLLLGKNIVARFKNRIINIHPSLIPSFCGVGYYGERVHKAVLEYGAKITGATVHFVDEGADTGPIILQEAVKVMQEDTPETLAGRVLKVEHKLLPEAVKLWAEDRLEIKGRKVYIKEY